MAEDEPVRAAHGDREDAGDDEEDADLLHARAQVDHAPIGD